MNNRRSFLGRAGHCPIPRLAALILVAPAWISLVGCKSLSPIDAASRNGDLDQAMVLLKGNPDLALSKDNDGDTPLHYAVFGFEEHTSVAELLLANGAVVNAHANNGLTPLHVAARWGHKDEAELLLAHGADVNARDNEGMTPLHYAAGISDLTDRKPVVELLLANNADVNARDSKGRTPLHYAAQNALRPDVAELLRQHGGQE